MVRLACYIRSHALTRLSKMVRQKGVIDLLVKLVFLYCFRVVCRISFGSMLFKLLYVYSTDDPPKPSQGMCPFFALFGSHPDYSSLKIFGSSCFPVFDHTRNTSSSQDHYHVCFLATNNLIKVFCAIMSKQRKLYI